MDDEKSTPVMVRLSPALLREIDDWRREKPELPGRPEAIRRLVNLAIHEHRRVRLVLAGTTGC